MGLYVLIRSDGQPGQRRDFSGSQQDDPLCHRASGAMNGVRMRRHRTVMFLVSVWLTASTAYAMAGEVGLFYSSGQPQTEFAANEIRSALKTRGDAVVAGDLL